MHKLKVLERGIEILEVELQVDSEYIVGRKSDCDIVLEEHPGISRQHFKVYHDGASWTAEVLSHFGEVFYQGQVTTHISLNEGDQFELRPYTFKFLEEIPEAQEDSSENQQAGSSKNLPSIAPAQNQGGPANPQALPVIQQPISAQNLINEFNEDNDDDDFIDEITNPGVSSVKPYIRIRREKSKKEKVLRLEGNYWVLGRDENCEITLPDPKASRKHFEIIKKNADFFISDLGSANGTQVNGQTLTKGQSRKLESGDIIVINNLSIFFEMRDPSFKSRLEEVPDEIKNNLPMPVGGNLPMAMNQQFAAPMMYDPNMAMGFPMEAEIEPPKSFYQKHKKQILLAAIAIVFLALLMPGSEESGEKDLSTEKVAFNKLSEDQQRIVIETYKLAKNLYIKGNFQLAATQLEKLHRIIDNYEESQQIAKFCQSSIDMQLEQDRIKEMRERERLMKMKVQSIIANCQEMAMSTDDIEAIKSCLAPARENDPSNPAIDSILTEVQMRQDAKEEEAKRRARHRARVQKGRVLFQTAEALKDEKKWLKAIDAYEKHISSAYPDPDKLKQKSQRSIASIETNMNKALGKVMQAAQDLYSQGNLANAINEAKKTLVMNPNYYEAVSFIEKVKKELNSQLRNIYTDSVLEERFGNIDAAKEKWRKIKSLDIKTGEYYNKAKRKLKQYGEA